MPIMKEIGKKNKPDSFFPCKENFAQQFWRQLPPPLWGVPSRKNACCKIRKKRCHCKPVRTLARNDSAADSISSATGPLG
jgi:hypothetical protein